MQLYSLAAYCYEILAVQFLLMITRLEGFPDSLQPRPCSSFEIQTLTSGMPFQWALLNRIREA